MPYAEALKISALARVSVEKFLSHNEVTVAGQELLDAVMHEHRATVRWDEFTPQKPGTKREEKLLLAMRHASKEVAEATSRYTLAKVKAGRNR